MDQRLARPHGDAPEVERHAGVGERLADEVVIADRGAADRRQHVGVGAPRFGEAVGERGGIVGRGAEIERLAARRRDDAGDGEGVGGDDLRRPARLARRDELVAARQDGDPRPAPRRQCRMVGGGGQRDVAGGQPTAGGQKDFAFDKITAAPTDVISRRDRRVDDYGVAVALSDLLHRHRIGALGQRRAGEDARRLAGLEAAGERAAGRGFADDGQTRLRACRVGRTQRVAVHRRIGERRLDAARSDVARQCAAKGLGERNELFVERVRNAGEHPRQRLLDRHQRGAAHPWLSARQCPDLPPRLSISRTAFDAHAAVDRLGHVVDGETGDGGGGQRLHLDPGRSDGLGLGADDDAGQRLVEREVDRDLGQGDRVAERDQLVRALGRHDAGDPRGPEHVALLRVAGADERQRLGPHDDASLGDRRAFGRRLFGDVDHASVAGCADVGEFCHGRVQASFARTGNGLRSGLLAA